MTPYQFEQLKISQLLDFRRECHAQRAPATDAEMQELERRLDRVGKTMSPDIHTDEQLPGCWVATDRNNYDGPGSPIGSGFSEQEAINDLLEQLEDE